MQTGFEFQGIPTDGTITAFRAVDQLQRQLDQADKLIEEFRDPQS
jgi:hypothetical protein